MYLTHAIIRPRSITVFDEYMLSSNRKSAPPLTPRKKNVAKGKLSRRSRSRLLSAIDWLLYTANYKTVFVKETQSNFRYKVNFITLTLPSVQVHTDTEIVRKCLQPFLNAWLKRRAGLLYVWKSEVQDNGNIHFHIISNSFYHYRKLMEHWNRYINILGYVDRSEYSDPNSTDVHAIAGKKDLGLYLTSYMAKKDVYCKPLKRWHKMYDDKLRKTTNDVVMLPRNYFKNIKRKVSCSVWSASKMLLGIKVKDFYKSDSESWKTLAKRVNETDSISAEFADIVPVKNKSLEIYPEFQDMVRETLKDLYEKQKQNVIAESIESL